MNFSLNRIILFVQDVELLKNFYQQHFGFQSSEETPGEWVVLHAGNCELALHKMGEGFASTNSVPNSNAKMVFETTEDLHTLRSKLSNNGVSVGELKSFSGMSYLFCDGADAEGNVFQLMQKVE